MFVVCVDMLRIWPTKETYRTSINRDEDGVLYKGLKAVPV